MSQNSNWKSSLLDVVDPQIAENISHFESEIQLKKQGKIEDKLFAETRLRLGLYGQRYDNGSRFDGNDVQTIDFPNKSWTKGPDTQWDAPGMVRIKIPKGDINPEQMDLIADLSEEYSDQVSHITTRQDIQLHFIHLDDTPDLMYRLASVGITTQEACGNSVRNVTSCPISGICSNEAFNVDPYATATFKFLLGHPDTVEFGRKFKIAFSGCGDQPCALTNMHDLGLVAEVKKEGGKELKGFKVFVGGGLGAVPHEAKVLYDFLPVQDLLPVSQAVCRIFSRLGEKKNRALARIKFLVAKLGIEEFKNLVAKELKTMRPDPKWLELIENLEHTDDRPRNEGQPLPKTNDPDFESWRSSNTSPQLQENYVSVTIKVPLGDLSPDQMRGLAEIGRQWSSPSIRLTVEQNVVLRWVSLADLPKVFQALKTIGLSEAKAGTITDITACPGTDTCKLGTSSSRGLAFALQKHLNAKKDLDTEIENLKIKISGCYNSCGQHHLSDIGFYGVSRKKNGKDVPHFQVVLGGKWSQDPESYGLPIAAVPSKSIPSLVDKVAAKYKENQQNEESFHGYISRIGKKEARSLIEEFIPIPEYEENSDFYFDWGDPRPYSTGDKGVGECAGEIVSLFEFDINVSERQYFEGQVAMDEKKYDEAVQKATNAMLSGAKALIKVQYKDVRDDQNEIIAEFKKRYCDSSQIFPSKFAQYLFDAVLTSSKPSNHELARQRLQETNLFIEEVHACRDKAANVT